jgi:hypothetical protein
MPSDHCCAISTIAAAKAASMCKNPRLREMKFKQLVSRFSALLCAGIFTITLCAGVAWAANVPSLNELAQGKYSRMHMLLEKTLLKIDVALIDVAVDAKTQAALKAAAQGKSHSSALEGQLAKIALGTDDAVIQLKFVRDVSLDQWIDGVRESLVKAEQAGLLQASLRKEVSAGLPKWFAAVKPTGFKNGDRILYRVKADGLRSVVITKGGKVIVDRTDSGADKPDMVLASYFAPGTDYRELLIRSLF